ncbi:MAG TPA: PAS domain S-box protein [Clostridia bacterium]|nr:PAS domain S-box protein [Clostridia bacterium]
MKQTDGMRANKPGSALNRSLFVTAVYALVGYIWIIATELAVISTHPESPEVFMISISKGMIFVTLTAILIFILVFTNLRKIIRETNDRLKNESALKEAQRLAHIGSFSFHTDKGAFQFSEEAARILELDDTSSISSVESLLRHVHIDDRERVFSLAKEAVFRGDDVFFDCRILQMHAPERTVQVRLQSVLIKTTGRPFIFGTLQDITERVVAEQAAREYEAIYKTLLNSSYDLIYLKDSSLKYIALNTNMQHYYGVSEAQLIGKQLSDIKPNAEARLWESRDRSVLLSGKPLYIEDTSGEQAFETIIFPVEIAAHKRGVGGISRDITQRKESEAIVIQERDRAQTYFDIAAVLFVAFDREGYATMINRTGCDTLGLAKEEIVGKQWMENFVPEQDRAGVYEVMRRIYDGTVKPTDINENGIINANNEVRQIEWRNVVLRDVNGEISGVLSAGVDVTNLRKTNEALRESERSKSVLLSNLPGMAYRCAYDRNWTMQFVSTGCFELTGYLPDELIDNAAIAFNDIICPEYREPVWEESFAHLSAHESNQYEYEILTAAGERKWVLDINQGVLGESGDVVALEGIIVDITKSKLQFLQIQYLSNHDQLTGLHNRQYYDNAKKSLDQTASLPLSVVFVDINGLKLVNDAFGYDIGDHMIQTTAAVLKASVLPNEIIARIGGDEFGLLLPNTDARACAERMLAFKEAFDAHNAKLLDRTLIINLSIGGSTKTSDRDDLAQVVKDAEANMARRKLFDQKSHHNAVLSSIMATLFERSFETEEHAERIGAFCANIGERLGLSHDDIDRLKLFAYLHDIGKIGISDQILNKPAALNEEELIVMKTHPEIGYRIAMASPDFAPIAELILTHHERWDGTGYPNRIAGERIPLLSRILAVADAYDAMTEDRVYRKALPREVAMNEIRKNAGTQFDPYIAEVFLEIIERDDL